MKQNKLMIIRSGFMIYALMISGLLSGQAAYDCLLKAKALSFSGRNDQAIEILSSALNVQKDGRLFYERGEANLNRGDYQDAISDFNNASNLIPFSGEYGLAKAFAIKGDAVSSLMHLEKNIKSPLKKSEKEIMLEPAFNKIENTPEWRQFWKKDWYTDAEKSIAEIKYYLSAGKGDEANESLTLLEKNYPDSKQAEYAKALVSLSAGKFPEVIKLVTGLIESDPDNVNYLEVLAKAQAEDSNPAGASVTYSKLISMEIPDAELFIKRAECYKKTGEIDKAMADVTKYLDYYPESQTATSMAGRLESLSGNNLKAIEFFSRNLKLHPNDPACYIDRANAYLLSKSWEWAANDYSMSLDLDPGNSDAWLNMGVALAGSGKVEDACFDFRKSLSLGNKRAPEYISRYCIK